MVKNIGLSIVILLFLLSACQSDCSKFNLTPEECANSGTHTYKDTCLVSSKSTMECNCPEETIEHKTDFSFSNGSFFWSAVDLANPWEKTDMNTYVNNESGTTRLDSANIWLEESTMTFNESGFRTEITIYTLEGSCTFINDNVIVK